MITGINLNDVLEYSLSDDKENPTIFLLGTIPTTVVLSLSLAATQKSLETTIDVLQLGLKGWKNCAIEYKKEKKNYSGRDIEVTSKESIDSLPANAITELVAKILEINKLSEQERKNS